MTRIAHYLRPNDALRYPRRLLVMVPASYVTGDPDVHTSHRFRCAAARFVDTRKGRSVERSVDDACAWNTGDLWSWASDHTRTRERTVLVCHSLGQDLRITDALASLMSLGWAVKSHAISGDRAWINWTREGATLVCVDSRSWIDASLEVIASDLDRELSPEPDQTWAPHLWDAYNLDRLDVLTEAVEHYLGWCETEEMGSWRMTGPSQASAAYRHRFMRPRSIIAHDIDAALADERIGCWTGRAEAWRHGLVEGPLTEWDYRLSYATIARDVTLPVRLRGEARNLSDARLERIAKDGRYLAHCVVTTAVPVVPASHAGSIVWPVGTFDTTLWDCEVALARQEGATVEVSHVWHYTAEPALGEWARWLIDRLDGADPETDKIVRRVLKTWSRTLIGRYGLMVPVLDLVGTQDASEVLSMPLLDADTLEAGSMHFFGHDVWVETGRLEAADSVPAIMSVVMAEARCRLWRATKIAGQEHVAYIDTDSMIVTPEGHANLICASLDGEHQGLRVKHRFGRADIAGPRALMLDHHPKIAGLPRRSVNVGPGLWRSTVAEGIGAAFASGRTDEVRTSVRTVRMTASDPRREHLPGGRTAPLLVMR